MRLNLGAGDRPLEGWENLDRKHDQEIFPLPYPDASAEAIRASHVLEHFGHTLTGAVLADWVRVLAPGGLLQIAVPDFEWVAQQYLAGNAIPVQGYVMGGQVDANDHHGAIFDCEALTDALHAAGLIGITRWVSEAKDCASLPVSLNLQASKPPAKWPKVSAVMSTPRLGFMDNFFCAFQALSPLKISLRKHTGAFWGQCLTRAIEEMLEEEDPDFILTLDYDTVFIRQDVESLLSVLARHPEVDAVAPVQASRTRNLPMLTIRDELGQNVSEVPWDVFQQEIVLSATAHLGLTLFRSGAFDVIPKPWFLGEPDADGRWGDLRTDDDVHFWRQWEAAGKSLYIAARVPVGHAELMIRWPGRDLSCVYQHPSEFWQAGKPEDVWR